jgi:hypothetical protein
MHIAIVNVFVSLTVPSLIVSSNPESALRSLGPIHYNPTSITQLNVARKAHDYVLVLNVSDSTTENAEPAGYGRMEAGLGIKPDEK